MNIEVVEGDEGDGQGRVPEDRRGDADGRVAPEDVAREDEEDRVREGVRQDEGVPEKGPVAEVEAGHVEQPQESGENDGDPEEAARRGPLPGEEREIGPKVARAPGGRGLSQGTRRRRPPGGRLRESG